jgi:hypothetical protein
LPTCEASWRDVTLLGPDLGTLLAGDRVRETFEVIRVPRLSSGHIGWD